ncbi:MAG: dihydroorotate dehydrogenase [Armatimonadetes bacterium]|nr:dihydroorotate dehydrogenase [Armatimonadota bacterium]
MAVEIGPVRLKNPVTVASGTFGFGREYAQLFDLSQLGGIFVKGTSLEPRRGNPPQRIYETAAGMLNSIGLQNDGVEAFIAEKLPFLNQFDTQIFVNIVGNRIEEYAELARILDDQPGVAGLEINISCPNVEHGHAEFASDPTATCNVVSAVRRATGKVVIPKLSPNVTDITAFARASEDGGADAVSLINTLVGTAIDVKTRRFRLANVTGGLSGPCIKPIALRMVYQCAQTVSIPVIGIGGISTWTDAVEFLLAGATAIQVGTASFANPLAALEIIDGVEAYLQDNGLNSPSQITGKVERGPVDPVL